MKVQKLNCRQAHYLLRFDFTLKHILRTKIGKADGLSRQLDQKVGVEKDNWIRSLEEVIIEGPEVDIVEKIKKARSKDEEIVRIVEEMKNARVKKIRGEEWKIEGDLVIKEGKIYILKDGELRVEIIWLHHDVLVAGHGG